MCNTNRWIRLLTPVLLLPLLAPGCGPSEDVTLESIRAARQRWERAGLRDYNLEWVSSGARPGHYLVYVRGGQVRQVRSVSPEGRERLARPGEAEYYGVDGLFRTIEEELDLARSERPFGRPPGTEVLLKFEPDPQLGYPRRYRRDVAGTPLGLSIDVVRIDPDPPQAIPLLPIEPSS